MNIFVLYPEIKNYFSGASNPFDEIMQLKGEVFRKVANRCTQRITTTQGKSYFIKQHFGVGWIEIFKNILFGRMPVLGAELEWKAIQRLESLPILTTKLVGYGARGLNPAKRQSFIMTEALPHSISLEKFCQRWHDNRPNFRLKCKLIRSVARIARVLHDNGINHRDFYICHFLLDLKKFLSKSEIELYLIDLHRVQIRKEIPMRWRIKDLAGLYFSSKNIGLTKRDYMRFIKAYHGEPLRDKLKDNAMLWKKVQERGNKLYQKQGS